MPESKSKIISSAHWLLSSQNKNLKEKNRTSSETIFISHLFTCFHELAYVNNARVSFFQLFIAGDHSTGVWVGGSDNGHEGRWAWFPTGKNADLRTTTIENPLDLYLLKNWFGDPARQKKFWYHKIFERYFYSKKLFTRQLTNPRLE